MAVGPGCPDRDTCARRYRVGFLQNVLECTATDTYASCVRYIQFYPDLPAVDAMPNGAWLPFYHDSAVRQFTKNGDTVFVAFRDSPGHVGTIPWRYVAQLESPEVKHSFGDLKQFRFAMKFRTWLAVENTSWTGTLEKYPAFGFRCLYQIEWGFDYQLDVDVNQPIGSCSSADPGQIRTTPPWSARDAPLVTGEVALMCMKWRTDYDNDSLPYETDTKPKLWDMLRGPTWSP